LDQHNRPFFRAAEGGVDEGFVQIERSSGQQVFGQSTQNPLQTTFPNPLLEPAMASLVRRIFARQILPTRPRAQNPQYSVQHLPRIAARPATTARRF